MVSRLRLCSATQSARASASATVVIASTSTASYSPKIKVDVMGSKPSASPKGFGRSPAITFPGAVKTLTPSVFDVLGAVMCVVSLAVLERSALSDLDNIAVRIADVAANLAVLGYWLRDELGSSTFPQFIARLDIRNAYIHKAVDLIGVGDAKRYRRLVGGRAAPVVDKEPCIRDLNVRRRAVAVAFAQDATAEDRFVEASRSVDVGDGEKMCDADSFPRGHLITLPSDLHALDGRLRFRCGHEFQKRLSCRG